MNTETADRSRLDAAAPIIAKQLASLNEGGPLDFAAPAPVVGSGGVVGPLAARHWKAPFRYDAEGAMIWDANNKRALDVRGWGHLTGKGALGLSAAEAEKITADFGQSVVAILNAQWPNTVHETTRRTDPSQRTDRSE